ncbi:MAG: UDP-3-O-(3-hydroxymyristoyl)glucosamine N-acyltransferase [Magnetococcales bacterium]|nr:UDP-3-O-(3-hydroxymyristoyl)glucosamine N-acyltransferase [Magnetococcales bacterium]
MKLSRIAEPLGLVHQGGDPEIFGVAPVEEAGAGDLTFVTDRKFLARGMTAAAMVISPALAAGLEEAHPRLLSEAPALDVAEAAKLLGYRELTMSGVHPSAVIDDTAELGEGVAVGARAFIGPRVQIGAGSVIHPGVVIHEGTRIGARCVIQSNSVIGSDGFGLDVKGGRVRKIPHFGVVRIEDDVEIGACVTVDRARFGETVIGAGSRIDNLVQIAHNVRVGRGVVIVAQVGIAGSCRIEDGVVLAGQVGLVPHVTVGKGARVGASTGVAGDVPPGAVWSGWWGQEHRRSMTELVALRKLPEFMKMVKDMFKKQGWE